MGPDNVLLEQLLGLRQQARNMAQQLTFLIEQVRQLDEPEVANEVASKKPSTFGSKKEITGND